MVTSSYSPNTTVEIAFDSGFLTPAASRTWTDVSDYVELKHGITITCGRGDERSTADANQVTLTLDNRDGRFTPGKTGGAYYPNVKLDRPIRVTSDPVDGAASVRFLGFVNEWPVSWEGTDGYAKVTVTASSRLSRLGSVAAMKSLVETAIIDHSPVAYYTMGEPSGSTQANDSSGTAKAPMLGSGVGAVVAGAPLPTFGSATGPDTDSLTAVQFATGGQYLRGSSAYLGTSGFTLLMFVNVPAGTSGTLGSLRSNVSNDYWELSIDGSGFLVANHNGGITGNAVGTTAINDGHTHCIAVTHNGGSVLSVYVAGVLENSDGDAINTITYSTINEVVLGASKTEVVFDGLVVAHAALFNTALSAGDILDISNAGTTGFAGETTSARLIRYAGYAGVEAGAVSAETGQTTVQHIDTTGKQVVELMRSMEATEGGVLFDNRDGVTTFHNRAHRLTTSAIYTLDMAQQMVESDYSPKLDRTGLANDVTAVDTSGRFAAHVFDATSQTDNGFATLSIETASEDDDEPLFQAGWALYKYKAPLSRVATLSVDALAQVGKTPNCAAVMATNMGDKITVSNRPSQDSASSASFFVEGWTETYGLESLRFTFNVSPSSPEDTTLIIGNAAGRGVIGTNPVAL